MNLCTHGRSSPTRRLSRATGDLHTTSPNRNRVGLQLFFIETPRLIPPKPRGEIIHLIPVRENGRKANDAPLVRVCAPKEPLDLRLIADFALVDPNHVAFIEYKKAHVVEQRRIVPQREVNLLGCGDDDVTLTNRVLIETADSDAAIERGNWSFRADRKFAGA